MTGFRRLIPAGGQNPSAWDPQMSIRIAVTELERNLTKLVALVRRNASVGCWVGYGTAELETCCRLSELVADGCQQLGLGHQFLALHPDGFGRCRLPCIELADDPTDGDGAGIVFLTSTQKNPHHRVVAWQAVADAILASCRTMPEAGITSVGLDRSPARPADISTVTPEAEVTSVGPDRPKTGRPRITEPIRLRVQELRTQGKAWKDVKSTMDAEHPRPEPGWTLHALKDLVKRRRPAPK